LTIARLRSISSGPTVLNSYTFPEAPVVSGVHLEIAMIISLAQQWDYTADTVRIVLENQSMILSDLLKITWLTTNHYDCTDLENGSAANGNKMKTWTGSEQH